MPESLPQEKIDGLGNYIGEYLECHLLVGFDDAGNPVISNHIPSARDFAAIKCLLQECANPTTNNNEASRDNSEDWKY